MLVEFILSFLFAIVFLVLVCIISVPIFFTLSILIDIIPEWFGGFIFFGAIIGFVTFIMHGFLFS